MIQRAYRVSSALLSLIVVALYTTIIMPAFASAAVIPPLYREQRVCTTLQSRLCLNDTYSYITGPTAQKQLQLDLTRISPQVDAIAISENKKKNIPSPSAQPITPITNSSGVYPTQIGSVTPGHTLNADLLFTMVNDYRVKNGLAPFEKDEKVCEITRLRAPELYPEIIINNNMHAGFYGRNLPYQAAENIIYFRTEEGALNWWLNEPLHKKSIVSDYKYSCISCAGEACSQVFTSFVPR